MNRNGIRLVVLSLALLVATACSRTTPTPLFPTISASSPDLAQNLTSSAEQLTPSSTRNEQEPTASASPPHTPSPTLKVEPTTLPAAISTPSVTPTRVESTSEPTATATPTSDSAVLPSNACRKPIDDYARVDINGEIISRRTLSMLETAMELYDGPGDLLRVTQGSYTDAESASFGTHAGGGAVDISIRNPVNPDELLFDEVEAMILALRQAGFAAWYRPYSALYEGSPLHIHAIAIGDSELSPAAQEQLTSIYGYFKGMDGLPKDTPEPDPHGGPVICPWMIDADYIDLR